MGPDQPTPAAPGAAAEPLVLKTFRPSGQGRRFLGWAGDAAILGFFIVRARRGASARPAWVAAACMATSIAIGLALRQTFVENKPYPEHYDPRDEVVIPAELVARWQHAETGDDQREALQALRAELGLSLLDAGRALALVLESGRD